MLSLYYWPISYTLDPNLKKSLNPNHVLNTLILPGWLLLNTHLHQISPTLYNYHPVTVTLYYVIQD